MILSSPRTAEPLRCSAGALVFTDPLSALAGPLFACLLMLFAAAPVRAADTATQFVEQLRAEGHADLVLEYLERAQDDPLVSDAFKQTIPYQRLATRLESAQLIKDPAARSAALEEIEPELRQMAAGSEEARRLQTDVADRLATAAADSARRSALSAERNPVASERAAARKTARSEIDAARDQLSKAESLIVAERETLKGNQAASPEGRRQADLGARLGLVRLLNARLLHEKAQTYPDNAADRKRLNTEAAQQLGALYDKYSKWVIGLYAHLYEGRCYRLIGNHQLAAAALEDLTAQPASTPELRRIVTLAHAELSALALDKGDLDEALTKPSEWLDDLSADEQAGPEAATLRYRLGVAALAKAETIDGAAQRKLLRDAREWLGESARTPSDVQADARDRWAEVTASLGIETAAPKTFEEAVAAGAEAIQSMLAFDVAMKGAAADEAERLASQRRSSYAAAYAALEAAVKFADDKTDPAEAARARYQLAWLDWDGGDAAKAATRAEYVARRDADTESGEQAARLALAAFEKLQRNGDATAADRLAKLADFILQQWPGEEVAEAASTVLVSSALRSGDLAQAEKVLAAVPESQRPELALRLAVARWEQGKSDPALAPTALKAMQAAFEKAAADGDASPLAVTAALYLADEAITTGDAKRGEKLLNDARYGPMTRLEAGEAPADTPVFAVAVLKAAIRSAALTNGKTPALIEQLANLLDESPAEQTGGERAWLGLAVALLADLDSANSADSAQATPVAAALDATLDQLDGVQESGDWNTRLWIAQARLRVGEVLGDTSAGRESLAAGRAAFAGLIAEAERRADFAPSPTAVLAARLKLAECQRELGEFAEAVETLTDLLDGGPVLLDVQRVAAETLQAWGASSKDTARLEEAIAGARPGSDGKNLIWGWSKLAAVAGRFAGSDPGRRQLYLDAWRHVAESRYESAMLSSGATRTEQLRKAASTIVAVQRKNPELGSAESKRAYDELLRRIQRASGQPADGLTKAGA
ncbi:hypothetical protein [Botrimarina colliarenosi]|uniref:hypothetical protein n=1 Tax=Botrimarina colliarenosi TaxID=2528001 RepID=UPI0011B6529B|nr:hypothetical protein [Botrimarina colliarenosi]